MYKVDLLRYLSVSIILSFFSIANLSAQCEGAKNSGQQYVLGLLTPGSNATFTVGGFALKIELNGTGDIDISGPTGATFHTDGAGKVQNVATGTDIEALSNYEAGPVSIFNTTTNIGAFGGGTSGFIALQINGKYGWLAFNSCGSTTCNDYVVTVNEGGLNQSGTSPVTAGNCATLVGVPAPTPDPIPTLNEWGLLIFGLLVLNLGLILIHRKSMHSI